MKNKKLKLYYFPSASKNGYGNPYSLHVKAAMSEYYEVLDGNNTPCPALSLGLLKKCIKADVFLFNWIENIGGAKLRYLQFAIVCFAFSIIRFRKAKISWTLHNIEPHEGDGWISKFIRKYLFKHANLIVCHSMAAADYARKFAHGEVVYLCHPLQPMDVQHDVEIYSPTDLLIWGKILPYKGVPELLENRSVGTSTVKITIIGQCDDKELLRRINASLNSNVLFENRKIDFSELRDRIKAAKYVLFPYIGRSVSSSGALMDTIALGGTPLGPCVGAFKDLSKEGVCQTYNTYEEILDLLNSYTPINEEIRNRFIRDNSWCHFAEILHTKMIK